MYSVIDIESPVYTIGAESRRQKVAGRKKEDGDEQAPTRHGRGADLRCSGAEQVQRRLRKSRRAVEEQARFRKNTFFALDRSRGKSSMDMLLLFGC